MYTRINSTKPLIAGGGNASGSRLESRVCAKSCARGLLVFRNQSGGGASIRLFNVVRAVMWLRQEGRNVRETRTEGCHAKWRELCGCNPAIANSVCIMAACGLVQWVNWMFSKRRGNTARTCPLASTDSYWTYLKAPSTHLIGPFVFTGIVLKHNFTSL